MLYNLFNKIKWLNKNKKTDEIKKIQRILISWIHLINYSIYYAQNNIIFL